MNNPQFLSPKQRRQRNREEMTAAIVQTARDIMREQGVASLNLNEIARRLGMQTPSLYEYFPNKMALYDHLFRLGTRLFRDRMPQAAVTPELSSWEQLEGALTAYLQCAIENPELFKLVYERHVPGFVPSDESMSEAVESLEAFNQHLTTFVQTAQLDTGLTIEQMRDVLITILHGLTALHLSNHPDQPAGEGRFGGLMPVMMGMLKTAWGKAVE